MTSPTIALSKQQLAKVLLTAPAPQTAQCTTALDPDECALFEQTINYAAQPLHVICTRNAIIYAGFIRAEYNLEYQQARARELWLKHHNTQKQPDKNLHKKIHITPWPKQQALPTTLCLLGTDFQQKIWQELLRIPCGHLATYKTLGQWLNPRSKAYQAIGNAVGANPISGIIPCHRIIPNPNLSAKVAVGGFYWGADLKIQLLNNELALPLNDVY